MTELDVNEDDSVYYDGGYWNDFDGTQRMFNQRIAGGGPGPWFHDYFAAAPSRSAGAVPQLRERMGRAGDGGGRRHR